MAFCMSSLRNAAGQPAQSRCQHGARELALEVRQRPYSHAPLIPAREWRRVARKRLRLCRHSLNPAVSHDHPSSGPGVSCDDGAPTIQHGSNGTGHAHGSHDDADTGTGVHVHHEKGADWGPLRNSVYALLYNLRVLEAASFLSHSLRAALLSAACFGVSALMASQVPAAAGMPSLATVPSAVASCALAISLVLSGLPAFIDAILQVRRVLCCLQFCITSIMSDSWCPLLPCPRPNVTGD